MKMSVEQAYKILAVPRSADIKAIKKKYRKLMLKVHPDSLKSGKNTYQYSAQEINEAYSIIIKYLSDNKMSGYFNNSSDDSYSSEYTYDEEYYQDYNSYASDGGNWDAPVNDNAYTSRNIYHYAEGARDFPFRHRHIRTDMPSMVWRDSLRFMFLIRTSIW